MSSDLTKDGIGCTMERLLASTWISCFV